MDALRVAMRSWVGRTIAGRYRLERLLGAGGMGAVFEATHLVTRGRVALKVVPCDGLDPVAAARFAREASAASRADHPAVVRVHDAGHDPGAPCLFVAQELLRGRDLRDELAARGRLPWREAVARLLPAVDALRAAHAAGLVHRDVKPENLFLARTRGGTTLRVLDWGIAGAADATAALTATGAVLGTAWYMAPEALVSARDAGPQADVWAVGVVLHECVAGAAPFDGDDVFAVLAAVRGAPVPRLDALVPDVPPALADAVARCLERDLARRWPSMAALLGALLDAADLPGADLAAELAPPPEVPARPTRSNAPTLDPPPPPPVVRPRRARVQPWLPTGAALAAAAAAVLAVARAPRPVPAVPPVPSLGARAARIVRSVTPLPPAPPPDAAFAPASDVVLPPLVVSVVGPAPRRRAASPRAADPAPLVVRGGVPVLAP